MKVVLDTNVIISGLLFSGGSPDRIVRALLTGRLRNITSPDLLTELRRVMLKKFSLSEEKLTLLIGLVADNSTVVYPLERFSVVRADDADNRVLECAFTGGANYIVTGDARHLLNLKVWKDIHLVSPADFVERATLV